MHASEEPGRAETDQAEKQEEQAAADKKAAGTDSSVDQRILGRFPKDLAPKNLDDTDLRGIEIHFDRGIGEDLDNDGEEDTSLTVEEFVEHPERLVKLKHEIESGTKDGVTVSVEETAPERVHDREDLFLRFAKPYTIEGKIDAPAMLYFGGLSTTGYSWRDFAMKMYDRSLSDAEVYSLKGHEGPWENLKSVHWREWVDDIVDRAKEHDKPIFFGYSTGAAAGLVAAAENPDLFSAMVLVGVPLSLQGTGREAMLRMGTVMQQIGLKSVLESASVSISSSGKKRQTKQLYRAPSFLRVPIPTLLNFWRITRHARKALPKIEVPMLIIQGGKDELIAPDVPDYIKKRATKSEVTLKRYPKSEHGVMMDLDRGRMAHFVSEWLAEQNIESSPAGVAMDFKPGKVRSGLVRDIIDLADQRDEKSEKKVSQEEKTQQPKRTYTTEVWGPELIPSHEDIAKLGDLFEEAYGASYRKKSFPGADKLTMELQEGERYIVIVRADDGSIAGQGAVQVLPDRSAKLGRLVVAEEHQGQKLGKQVQKAAFTLVEGLAKDGSIDTAYCQLVTSHPITQKNLQKTAFRPSGIFDRKFSDLFAQGYRESVIRVEHIVNPKIKKERTVYLPSDLRDAASKVYAWLDCKREIKSGISETEISKDDSSLTLDERELAAFGAATIKLGPTRHPRQVMSDVKQLWQRGDVEHISAKVDISTPASHEQIVALQLQGFYFAAIEARGDTDYLVLQKPRTVQFAHVQGLIDDRANELLSLIQ